MEGHAAAKRLVLENIAGMIRAGIFKVVDPTITALEGGRPDDHRAGRGEDLQLDDALVHAGQRLTGPAA